MPTTASYDDIRAHWPFLVVGVGSIGRRHIANLRRLGVRRLWAYDPQRERVDEVEARWGVRGFASLDEALAAGPKVVWICSPPVYHIPQALAAARAGAHLFIEKPLSASLEGVDALIAEVEARNLRTLVGCNFRFHPGLQRLKALVTREALGRVIFARAEFGQYLPDWHPWEDYRQGYSARRALGGGVVLDRIHEVDYLVWLFGPVEEVTGLVGQWGGLDIETEDLAEAWLRFRSGVVAAVHVDYLNRTYTCRAELVGSTGTAWWSFLPHETRLYDATQRETRAWAWPQYEINQMYLDQARHFLRVLAGEEESQKDVRQARHILEVALAIKASAAQGRSVRL